MMRALRLGSMLPRTLPLVALFVLLACSPAAPSAPPLAPAAPPPVGASGAAAPLPGAAPARFTVTFPASLSATPLDGRLLLVLAKDDHEPPRDQVSDHDNTAQVYGIDVDGLRPGAPAVIDASVLGYQASSLAAIRDGDYVVEAVLHRYETFVRSDGHRVKLPADRGEGQDWTKAPGTLVSKPRKIHVAPAAGVDETIELSSALPELPAVPDTQYVKHVRIQSERLTRFWGRPTYLGAIVTLPEGWDTHPKARYPLVISHGHYQHEVSPLARTPPIQAPSVRPR